MRLQHDEIQNLIIDSEDVRKERERNIRDKINDSQAKLVKFRVNSLTSLRNTAENLRDKMRNNVKPYIHKVNKLSDRVRTEAGKLGLN